MTDFDFGDIDSPQIIIPDTHLDTSPTVAPPPTGKKYRVIISSEANKPSIRYLAINGVSRYVQVDVEVELEEEFVRMLSEGTRLCRAKPVSMGSARSRVLMCERISSKY